MLTLLSLVQFLVLKISEMDYYFLSVANTIRVLSLLSLLNYARSHSLKSTYENTVMKC